MSLVVAAGGGMRSLVARWRSAWRDPAPAWRVLVAPRDTLEAIARAGATRHVATLLALASIAAVLLGLSLDVDRLLADVLMPGWPRWWGYVRPREVPVWSAAAVAVLGAGLWARLGPHGGGSRQALAAVAWSLVPLVVLAALVTSWALFVPLPPVPGPGVLLIACAACAALLVGTLQGALGLAAGDAAFAVFIGLLSGGAVVVGLGGLPRPWPTMLALGVAAGLAGVHLRLDRRERRAAGRPPRRSATLPVFRPSPDERLRAGRALAAWLRLRGESRPPHAAESWGGEDGGDIGQALFTWLAGRAARGCLSEALSRHPRRFAGWEVALFRDGERSGDLASAAEAWARAWGPGPGSRQRVAWLPRLGLLAVGALAIASLTTDLAFIASEMELALPAIVRVWHALGGPLVRTLVLAVLLLAILRLAARASGPGRLLADWPAATWLPGARSRRARGHALALDLVALHLAAGRTVADSLAAAGEAQPNAWLGESLRRAGRLVGEGVDLADAFREAGVHPRLRRDLRTLVSEAAPPGDEPSRREPMESVGASLGAALRRRARDAADREIAAARRRARWALALTGWGALLLLLVPLALFAVRASTSSAPGRRADRLRLHR